jgi:hypothetical protein
MPAVVQPPMASMLSEGHSTALNLSLRLCLKLWITQPSGILGLSHLFKAALSDKEFFIGLLIRVTVLSCIHITRFCVYFFKDWNFFGTS